MSLWFTVSECFICIPVLNTYKFSKANTLCACMMLSKNKYKYYINYKEILAWKGTASREGFRSPALGHTKDPWDFFFFCKSHKQANNQNHIWCYR